VEGEWTDPKNNPWLNSMDAVGAFQQIQLSGPTKRLDEIPLSSH